jgi:epoxyqueuosine reductase
MDPGPSTTSPAIPAQEVQALARELEFNAFGVCTAEPSGHGDFLRQWLSAGKHGEMDYLARHVEQRLDPAAMVPGARSIICVADRHPHRPTQSLPQPSGPSGRVARYAWGDDYHKTIKKRLHRLADLLTQRYPGHAFRSSVDTAPVLEREHAQRAGLGWVGKHTLLIHPSRGSWLLLGQIITSLPIEAGPEHQPMSDHCGTCSRCIDACPTNCITAYSVDASRCISYLTIEHRSEIDPALHPGMGDWIAGCDVCQEVCPFNEHSDRRASHEPVHEAYVTRPPGPCLNLLQVLDWSPLDRQQAFTGSALKRIKLDMLKRNALIALGNHLAKHEHPALHRRIVELAESADEPPLIQQTARQVISRLQAATGGG